MFAYVAAVESSPAALLWLGFLALAVPPAYLAALRTPLQRLKPRDPGALSEWLAGAAWGLAVSAALAIGA